LKVLLISSIFDGDQFRIGENIGLKIIDSILKIEGFQTQVIDPSILSLSWKDMAKNVVEEKIDVVGLSIQFNAALEPAIKFIKYVKKRSPEVKIIVGGHVPSLYYDYVLKVCPEIDAVVLFDAENVIVDLLKYLNSDISSINNIAYIKDGKIKTSMITDKSLDLDEVPFQSRDSSSNFLGDPHFFMISSRGCPHRCSFCSVPVYNEKAGYNKWRYRSASNVFAEILYLCDNFEAKSISFLDDNFLATNHAKYRAEEIADLILENDVEISWSFECRADSIEQELFTHLRSSGLKHVFVGVESGVQHVLERYNKNIYIHQNFHAIDILESLNIAYTIGFIMFDPFTTITDIQENIKFLRRIGVVNYQILTNKLTVYKDTQIFYELQQLDLLQINGISCSYKFSSKVVERLFNAFQSLLSPYRAIDFEMKKIEFRLSQSRMPDKLDQWLGFRKWYCDVVLNVAENVITCIINDGLNFDLIARDIRDSVDQLKTKLSQFP
jgi:radical SAM superfamily enzyme YgiQ (UPF0313 family)